MSFVVVAALGVLCFGIGTIGEVKSRRKTNNNNNNQHNDSGGENGLFNVDAEAEIFYYQQRGFRYVYYARKMEKTNGTMIQCIRFYRDNIWFEYDILTGELLRSHYPYENEIKKIRRQNRFERNNRIKRRFDHRKTPDKIMGAKTSLRT